jgi:hypothetical protein
MLRKPLFGLANRRIQPGTLPDQCPDGAIGLVFGDANRGCVADFKAAAGNFRGTHGADGLLLPHGRGNLALKAGILMPPDIANLRIFLQ